MSSTEIIISYNTKNWVSQGVCNKQVHILWCSSFVLVCSQARWRRLPNGKSAIKRMIKAPESQ